MAGEIRDARRTRDPAGRPRALQPQPGRHAGRPAGVAAGGALRRSVRARAHRTAHLRGNHFRGPATGLSGPPAPLSVRRAGVDSLSAAVWLWRLSGGRHGPRENNPGAVAPGRASHAPGIGRIRGPAAPIACRHAPIPRIQLAAGSRTLYARTPRPGAHGSRPHSRTRTLRRVRRGFHNVRHPPPRRRRFSKTRCSIT